MGEALRITTVLAKTDPYDAERCRYCRVPWTRLEPHLIECLWQQAVTFLDRRGGEADQPLT